MMNPPLDSNTADRYAPSEAVRQVLAIAFPVRGSELAEGTPYTGTDHTSPEQGRRPGTPSLNCNFHGDHLAHVWEGVRPDNWVGRTPQFWCDPADPLADRWLSERVKAAGGTMSMSPEQGKRLDWLVQDYRADMDVVVIETRPGVRVMLDVLPGTEGSQSACRCYRCGQLLTANTVRLVGVRAGVRPACAPCHDLVRGR